MNLYNTINKIFEEKEKYEIIDELNKIEKHMNFIKTNNYSNQGIKRFIYKTIDKYRGKVLLKDYYNSPTGKDELPLSDLDRLNLLKTMIVTYVLRKEMIGEMCKERVES